MSSSLKSMVKEPTARLSATLNDRIEETTDSMDWTLVALSVLSSGCQKWRGLVSFLRCAAEFDPRFGAFQAQGDTLCTYHRPRLGALLNFPDPYGLPREWAAALHMDQIIIIRLSVILYKSWNPREKVSHIIFKYILRYLKYIIPYHIYIYRMSTQKNWNLLSYLDHVFLKTVTQSSSKPASCSIAVTRRMEEGSWESKTQSWSPVGHG
jgi:hypothetical protein